MLSVFLMNIQQTARKRVQPRYPLVVCRPLDISCHENLCFSESIHAQQVKNAKHFCSEKHDPKLVQERCLLSRLFSMYFGIEIMRFIKQLLLRKGFCLIKNERISVESSSQCNIAW